MSYFFLNYTFAYRYSYKLSEFLIKTISSFAVYISLARNRGSLYIYFQLVLSQAMLDSSKLGLISKIFSPQKKQKGFCGAIDQSLVTPAPQRQCDRVVCIAHAGWLVPQTIPEQACTYVWNDPIFDQCLELISRMKLLEVIFLNHLTGSLLRR